MWPCPKSWKGGVEVKLEARVKAKLILLELQGVDLVVAVEMDFAKVVFVQEIVGDDYTFIVMSEKKVMGRGTGFECNGG